MTTTVTAQLPRSSSHRFRRDAIAALAGATLFAESALVVNRITDDASHQAGGVAATKESTVDVTTINGAIPVATGPGFEATVVSPPMRLVTNEASSEACAMGYPEACPFAHRWVPAVVELVGIEDVVRGAGLLLAK